MHNDILINSIMYLIKSCLDMGDYLEDTASYLADEAGIDYDEYDDDAEDTVTVALDVLINNRSEVLTEFLDYYFTEDIYLDYILDDFVSNDQMGNNLKVIYNALDKFPGGAKVQSDMMTNVFNVVDTYALDAAKVGYAIGQEYWRYITNPMYGVRTNSGFAVGRRISDDPYVYEFAQDISSYYFRDAYLNQDSLPIGVGYEVRFREDGDFVVAEIFPFMQDDLKNRGIVDYVYADNPVDTITITDTSASGITDVAKHIAAWLDEYANDAINYWID